jgi:hypothetical protein
MNTTNTISRHRVHISALVPTTSPPPQPMSLTMAQRYPLVTNIGLPPDRLNHYVIASNFLPIQTTYTTQHNLPDPGILTTDLYNLSLSKTFSCQCTSSLSLQNIYKMFVPHRNRPSFTFIQKTGKIIVLVFIMVSPVVPVVLP